MDRVHRLIRAFLLSYILFVEWEVEYTAEFETWWGELTDGIFDRHLATLEKEDPTHG
jgi:hypothetical protein